MRAFLLILITPLLLAAQPTTPQTPDLIGLTAAIGRARVALERLPGLWGLDASDVEWILTDGRRHYASARRAGRDTLMAISLPDGTTIANTAVTVAGRRWAMVVLDLSRAERASVGLLVHEAMHTFQPERLPVPGATEPGEGGDLLDGADGRAWLFLELRALAAALRRSDAEGRDAARDALLFRAQRDAIASATERQRLATLELAEGIPEYTGLRLAGLDDSTLAARLAGADSLRISWVRAVGYWTGPGYGFLLDRLGAPSWRARQLEAVPIATLLAGVVGRHPESTDPRQRAAAYGGAAVFAAERARAAANAARLDSLRGRFVRGEVLRLIPGALQVSFDPNGQTPLGDAGTVMRNFRWAGADGAELVAPDGALVSADWSWIQVPLATPLPADGALREPLTVASGGWRLRLPAGWVVRRDGNRTELRPPSP